LKECIDTFSEGIQNVFLHAVDQRKQSLLTVPIHGKYLKLLFLYVAGFT
jgi:hypothetical protein